MKMDSENLPTQPTDWELWLICQVSIIYWPIPARIWVSLFSWSPFGIIVFGLNNFIENLSTLVGQKVF